MAGFSRDRAFLPLSVHGLSDHPEGMTLLILLAGLAALAVVVPRWGTDSRDGQDWRRACAERRRCRSV
jgi:hypothetical protein